MKEIKLCGVRIDNMTCAEAVEAVLEDRGKTAVVFTPNAVMLSACRRDPAAASLLNRATLSLPDGAGVLRAARRVGTPLRERVAGIDFGEALLARAAAESMRVFLLGGRPRVAERAGKRLAERFSGLSIAGTEDGYFAKTEEENARVLEKIRSSGADILFVCFGFPLQERWIAEHLPALSSLSVIAALGGSLDVWAGDLMRAPCVLSRCGMEWAWRMLREPKRLTHLPALLRFAVLSRHALLQNGGTILQKSLEISSQNAHTEPR